MGAWAAYTRMLGQRAVLVLCPHHPQSMNIFLGTLSLTPYSFRRRLFEWRGPRSPGFGAQWVLSLARSEGFLWSRSGARARL